MLKSEEGRLNPKTVTNSEEGGNEKSKVRAKAIVINRRKRKPATSTRVTRGKRRLEQDEAGERLAFIVFYSIICCSALTTVNSKSVRLSVSGH